MNKLILIDGSAVVYRSFFAFIRNPLINSRGENTGAVYGFVNSLMKIMNDYQPDYIAVVFDTPKPTFRHAIHPEYKATRAKMPEELVEQLPWVNQAIEGYNIKVISREGLEADDIIGTLSRLAEARGLETLMFSGDKDFFQLVTDKSKILHPKDFSILDRDGVKEKFGVPPEKVIDTLALMGDTSDNIPGIPGVGPKTAISLIEEFGDLETVLREGPMKKKGRIAELLEKYKDQALLSQTLVTIKTDCDIELNLDELKRKEPIAENLVPLFRRLEFKSWADKYAGSKAMSLFDQPSGKQSGPFKYKTVESLPELDDLLSHAAGSKEMAIDTETTSQIAIDASLVGISFCWRETEAFYIPVAHEQTGNLPLNDVLQRFEKLFASDLKLIGHNIKYDRQVFRNRGLHMRNIVFDTMIAAYLLDPGKRVFDLDSLALEFFDYRKVPIHDLIGKGKSQISFSQVPIDKASMYSCEDADFSLRLKNYIEPKLMELNLYSLLKKIEVPLIPVLGDMEETGVKIDLEFLKDLSNEYGAKLQNVERAIFQECGEEFNLNSPQQLGHILFDKLKLSSARRTAKGGARATAVDVLVKLATQHPVPRMVLEYRQLTKLKSTYIDALPQMINKHTGSVHTSFNQTIAATGRLSSSDPNLQNIPIKTDEGREIRKAFIPIDENHKILAADYSQIELRIMAHFADDRTMINSFQSDEDIHRRTAAEVYGVDIRDVTPTQRRRAKTANFAIIYGVSAFGLSQQSELTLPEAGDFIAVYFKRYPGIKKYMDNSIKFAQEHGYVMTLFERRRYLPDIKAQSVQARQFAERIAINMPVQGTAADMIKLAMIAIANKLSGMKSNMILQVHDELVFNAHVDEIEDLKTLVKTEMEQAVELRVPVKAEIAVGNNWLEAK